jgi:hypothetical protein
MYTLAPQLALVQAMLNRLAEQGDLRPLQHRRLEGPATMFGTAFLTDASGPLRSSGISRLRGMRPAPLALPEEASTNEHADKTPCHAFMESAVVFTTHAIRYGMFFGDDGTSVTVRLHCHERSAVMGPV